MNFKLDFEKKNLTIFYVSCGWGRGALISKHPLISVSEEPKLLENHARPNDRKT